jgi:hypothetical protein
MANKIGRVIAIGCMALLFVLLAGGLAQAAGVQVSVNVNIGQPPPVIVAAPPPVVVAAPPAMLYLPQPGLYVAVGTPYDIFFLSGHYYYYHEDHWFWAPGYSGPWVHVVTKSLPPGLQHYRVVQLREYREREYRVYKTQGPKFKGKYFIAEEHRGEEHHGEEHHGEEQHDDHDRDHNDHGNGRGRGHDK